MNWIVANLNAAIGFFEHWLSQLYDLLMINPISYQEGTIWAVVDKLYDAMLGPALSIFVSFFFVGLASDVGDFIKTRRIGPIVWTFIGFMFMAGILTGGKYLLLLIFWIGKELLETATGADGTNLISLSWIDLPDAVVNATNGLSMSSGIVFWVVTLICALVVMVCGFTIVMVVYGRLFKIYLHIAVAPLAAACVIAKPTRPVFSGFIRSFIGTCLEGLVIVMVCLIFSAFANGFAKEYPMSAADKYKQEHGENFTMDDVKNDTDLTEAEKQEIFNEMLSQTGLFNGDNSANAELLWSYLSRLMFLYLIMAGMIKGADSWLHQKLNL